MAVTLTEDDQPVVLADEPAFQFAEDGRLTATAIARAALGFRDPVPLTERQLATLTV